jgi:hypothetical protein
MADYRSVKVQMWRSDDWFQELPTDARLFWIYLFTNPSARVAGIYKITTKTMCFESGLSMKRIEELKKQFSASGKAYFENDMVWVVKMRELQSPGRISDNLKKGIDNDVAEIPMCELKRQYLIRYGYPMHTLSESSDTLCIPFPTTQHNTTQHNTTHRQHSTEETSEDSDGNALPGVTNALHSVTAPDRRPARPLSGDKPISTPLEAPSEGIAKKHSTRDPLLDHPAVVAYRDMAKLTPNAIQRVDIAGTVVDHLTTWQDVVRGWMSKGWKPGNVDGMLDRYREAVPQNGNGKLDHGHMEEDAEGRRTWRIDES